jgi:hypothetical protein
MIKIKKSAIGMIVLAFTSFILITGSPFQIATNLVQNNGHLGQKAYGADDDGGGDDGGGDDGGGDTDNSGDSDESSYASEESEETDEEENIDRSYQYPSIKLLTTTNYYLIHR